jgi:hypothetical protein
LPDGEIYLKYHSATNTDTYYLSEEDVPEIIALLTFRDSEDNRPLIEQYKGRTVKEVVFDGHTFFKNHKWNTLCLPFDVIGENIDLSPLSGADIWELDIADKKDYSTPTGFDEAEGTVTLNFKPARNVEPGKPYLFEWRTTVSGEIQNPVFENVTIKSAEAPELTVTSQDGSVQFVGTYAPETLIPNTTANLYMGNDDKLLLPTDNKEISPFNAYFLVDIGNGLGRPGDSTVKKIVMNISDGDYVVRVISIDMPVAVQDGTWHDLQGRKYVGTPTQSGIYIMDGRKIMIR